MAISARALERLGIHEAPDEIEKLVLEAMERMLSGWQPLDAQHNLTAAEKEALLRGGLTLERVDFGLEDPLLQAATEYSALVASGFTVAQAATLLGVDGSRIRQRLLNRTLYGIKLRSGWRIPRFQFEGDRLLPGIDWVLPRLRGGLHPVAVFHWFTLPNPDLVAGERGEPMSPRDWLRLGLDPKEVADLAAEL